MTEKHALEALRDPALNNSVGEAADDGYESDEYGAMVQRVIGGILEKVRINRDQVIIADCVQHFSEDWGEMPGLSYVPGSY